MKRYMINNKLITGLFVRFVQSLSSELKEGLDVHVVGLHSDVAQREGRGQSLLHPR